MRPRWDQGGKAALKSKGPAGCKSRLSPAQIQKPVAALEAGPVAAGHVNDLWTPPRVAALVQQLSGERYHAGHCRHWLRQPGFSGSGPPAAPLGGMKKNLRAGSGLPASPPATSAGQGAGHLGWGGHSPLPVGGLRGGHGGSVGASPAARLCARTQPGGILVGAPQRT